MLVLYETTQEVFNNIAWRLWPLRFICSVWLDGGYVWIFISSNVLSRYSRVLHP